MLAMHAPLPRFSHMVARLVALMWILTAACFGEWTQTVRCAPDHVYQDLRRDAGREEFCELQLPGSLVVKDGQYRSWFSEGHPGSVGNYSRGREVGSWKECDRFDHCDTRDYEEVFPEEKKRAAFRPLVPVTYQDGKFGFDFASCRSTWVTHTLGADPIQLNIGGDSRYNCVISIFPRSVMEHGGEGAYNCWIPYSVGVRKFDTVDLMNEFPKAGLPQFCRPQQTHPEPLMIRSGPEEIAFSLDLVCATVSKLPDGRGSLRIELNPFARDLVRDAAKADGPLNTLLCMDQIEGPQVAADSAGKTILTYQMSTDPAKARREQKCIREKIRAPMPCSH